jgi:hypothetical protein
MLICYKASQQNISKVNLMPVPRVVAAHQGYNGSQLWDTSFAVQAMLDSGLVDVAQEALRKAHSYIEQSQVSCNETSALIQSAVGSFELPLLLGRF